MQVDFDRLMQYHEDGKLRHSAHPSRDLHVWCYSQSTVYNRDWDDITRLARGLVTDGEGNIVSRPFPKFFNWGEPEAPTRSDTEFLAYDKLDGSLIVASTDANGDLVVSTKGSFTTWHSEMARDYLKGFSPGENVTAIFEFIDPRNRIVVDYKDFSGLVLLGAVHKPTGKDHYDPDDYAEDTGWAGEVVIRRRINLLNTLNTVQDPEAGVNREGFVLVYPSLDGPSARVKIKFAQYINLHRMLSRLNNVAVWEALSAGTFDVLLEAVPDELYDKVRECADELIGRHTNMVAHVQDEASEVSALHDNRKDQAGWVIEHCPIPSLVFKVLDGKDITEAAWMQVKPELDREWAFLK